ncbi:hypothetical protein NGM37_31100, partial [Streptomyces sp. TRM76130]|nr:hypothetical protein [Streptomyces sp. TRM76130]
MSGASASGLVAPFPAPFRHDTRTRRHGGRPPLAAGPAARRATLMRQGRAHPPPAPSTGTSPHPGGPDPSARRG